MTNCFTPAISNTYIDPDYRINYHKMEMLFKDFSVKDYVALYAGLLSTILLIIKFVELWQARFRIEADLWMIGDENQIYVYNHTRTTVTIKGFDLYYKKGFWPLRTLKNVDTGHELCGPYKIASNDYKQFTFSEENSFAVHPKYGKLFIKISFAGHKRPVRLLLWPFD
ncbi:hypothetical protein ACFJIV_28890 [Mucilaginibacter sp. UC70_90]